MFLDMIYQLIESIKSDVYSLNIILPYYDSPFKKLVIYLVQYVVDKNYEGTKVINMILIMCFLYIVFLKILN